MLGAPRHKAKQSTITAEEEIIENLIGLWVGPLMAWRNKYRNHRNVCSAQTSVLERFQSECLSKEQEMKIWGHEHNDLAAAQTKLNCAIAELLVNLSVLTLLVG